ncbi:1-deoxy-D-xylulose-5-phosphate synthase [Striga asiatica]|uniref:1-deoxy-D-xylulose-5-phosphate synthase n=1 Tax=Striga asiatica TaxID=4170 RepID=A0A5A7PK83_STRAF|nr:1-deoxy-D-xylulose-5-phosphate synthase [Striga asiatica]
MTDIPRSLQPKFYLAICEQHATTLAPSDKYDDVAQPQPFCSSSVQRATDEMQSDVIQPSQTSRPHPVHKTIARSFVEPSHSTVEPFCAQPWTIARGLKLVDDVTF